MESVRRCHSGDVEGGCKRISTIKEELGIEPATVRFRYLNFLVYGEFGAGKTRLASTAQDHPDMSPILMVGVEGGFLTIADRSDIDTKEVRTVKDLVEIHNKLKLLGEDNPYKTIALDSLTELQKLDMQEVMKEQYDKRPDSTDIDVPSRREWGKSGEHIRRVVRAYRDLDMHTIFTAHQHTFLDERTNNIEIFPSLPGKLRNEVPGFVDIVGYLHVEHKGEEVTRRLQLAKTKRVAAKDRTDSLGPMIDNPTLPEMWTTIKAKYNGGTSA